MINCALNLLKLTQLANIYVTIQILVQHREKKKRENKHMDTKGEAKVGWTERFRLTIYTLLMLLLCIKQKGASQVVLVVKNLPANAGDLGDTGLIPGLGRSPGEGNSNPLQYSCLENPMDRGTWKATVHGVTKSWTWLSDWTELNWKEKAIVATFFVKENTLYVYMFVGFPGGTVVKNHLPVQKTQEIPVWSLDQEDPLEEKIVTHSSILAWNISWTEEPGRV